MGWAIMAGVKVVQVGWVESGLGKRWSEMIK